MTEIESDGVEALMSLSQSQYLPTHSIRHVFFDSSDEDSDEDSEYEINDEECMEVAFEVYIPRNRDRNIASAQVQAFVIKYIEEWNETPSDSNLQLYISTIYGCGENEPAQLLTTYINIPIQYLDHERQVQILTRETEYKPPSPKKLCKQTLKKFNSAVNTIYCPSKKNKKKDKNDEDICVICMESVESGKMKKVQIKHCKHKFHKACLQKWVSCDWCCPTCKQPL